MSRQSESYRCHVRQHEMPEILCAWCKLVKFRVTNDQLLRILGGGHVFCSNRCQGFYRVWKGTRYERAR